MKTLQQLYAEHDGKISDKWGSYLKRYDELFAPLRDYPVTLVEVGVQNGGSLEIWGKYFTHPEAVIIGCDIDTRCARLIYPDPRIRVVIGDINTVVINAGHPHIFIDDGSHTSSDIINTFVTHWPFVMNDGLYIIEDLHCSYWASHNVVDQITSIEALKEIIDDINEGMGDVKSIEFSNSLCVIRKGESEIGDRLIVGKEKII